MNRPCYGIACPKRTYCERFDEFGQVNDQRRALDTCKKSDGTYPLFVDKRMPPPWTVEVEDEGAAD